MPIFIAMEAVDIRTTIKIYIFGDSIAFGQYIPVHETWVVQVSRSLHRLYGSRGIRLLFQNPSISGNTSRQALDRMSYDVLQYTPDILVIQFGLNDCNYWQTDCGIQRVTPSSFAANLQEIICRGKGAGIKRIIVNTNHATARTSQILPHTVLTYQMSNAQYNQIIRDTVHRINDDSVRLNDMERKIQQLLKKKKIDIEEMVLSEPDLLHLSREGHHLYYLIMKKELIKAIDSVLSDTHA